MLPKELPFNIVTPTRSIYKVLALADAHTHTHTHTHTLPNRQNEQHEEEVKKKNKKHLLMQKTAYKTEYRKRA